MARGGADRAKWLGRFHFGLAPTMAMVRASRRMRRRWASEYWRSSVTNAAIADACPFRQPWRKALAQRRADTLLASALG